MVTLYNRNIRKIVGNAIRAAGGLETGVLQKIEYRQDPANRNRRIPHVTNYSFNGTLRTRKYVKAGELVTNNGMLIQIIADYLPVGVIPDSKDKITMRGETYDIKEVKNNPADSRYDCIV